MSTLQFVILLVVIFLSTNGPTHVATYVRKLRAWFFKRRVEKIGQVLKRHGLIFCTNSAKDFSAMCLYVDFVSQTKQENGYYVITPTFTFPIIDKGTREFCNKKGQKLIADFLYELCNKQFPREYFSEALLRKLPNLCKSKKELFVPQNIPLGESLFAMKNRLDQYLIQRR